MNADDRAAADALAEGELSATEAAIAWGEQARRDAARMAGFRIFKLDAEPARHVWDGLTALAAELTAVGAVDAAAAVGALARMVAALQLSQYGAERLTEMGLTPADV